MYLVTGGAGYFGECLVRQLVAAGQRVRVFDLNPLEGYRADQVECIEGDIRDEAAVHRATEGAHVVLHNVAQVPLAKDFKLFWSVNHDGTKAMLQSALAHGVKKVVYTSSSAVYGVPLQNPVNEQSASTPAESYGRAKLGGEQLCHEYAAKGLDVSIVRPRTIVGHGRLGIFQILFEWIHQGYNIPVFDDGKNVFQFVHADDLADMCLRAAQDAGPNTFCAGAEKYGTMRETLEAVCAHAGTGSKVKSLPFGLMKVVMDITSAAGLSPLGPYHALLYGRNFYFDTSKAKAKLGWSAHYSSIEMLCQSYDWYAKNREAVLHSKGLSVHRSGVKQGILNLLPHFL